MIYTHCQCSIISEEYYQYCIEITLLRLYIIIENSHITCVQYRIQVCMFHSIRSIIFIYVDYVI